jgi:aerobic carbon-monoxide dehydrogenase medium subunit
MRLVDDCGYIATSFRTLMPCRGHRPQSVDDAIAISAAAHVPCVIAGGSDLPAQFNAGFAPTDLIDVGGIREFKTLDQEAGGLVIGACVTHYEGAARPLVREYASGFAAAWGKIANVRVRFSATIGGNLMARRTRYECLILLSALEANARLRGPAGTFELPVEKLWSATLPKGTLLTAVGLPARNRLRFDYERSLRPIMTQADREIADCARLDPERQYRLYAVR